MTAPRSEPCACGETITVHAFTAAAIAAVLDRHYSETRHRAWRTRARWDSEIPYSSEAVPTGAEMRAGRGELVR